ncbi:MAG: FAD-dependent oxidoreductase [Vicinamibacteria bacterium]|nr:FAD-dependent oxidoreductase [Vicinamibacteria bacterium]
MTRRTRLASRPSAQLPVVVLGAGLTGLSAAYHLERGGHHDYLVLEAEDRVGGLLRTEHVAGFSFDHAIHILYTREEYVSGLIHDLLRDNLGRQRRRSYCHSAGVYTEYPYQTNNFGLPPEVIADNVLGLISARHESLQEGPPEHYEAWLLRTFGRGIADHFMLPYNRKQWAWDLQAMSYDWIEDRVPVPSIRDVLLGALRRPLEATGPNREFWYPRTSGIEALALGFVQHLPRPRLRLSQRVVRVDPARREIALASGERLRYGSLISTLPLGRLVAMLGDAVPPAVVEAARGLLHNTVHTVNVGLRGTTFGPAEPMHWAYYPDADVLFHRISFPHRFSAAMAPPGCASLQAEISESSLRPVDRGDIVRRTLADLVRVGLLTADEILPVERGGRVALTQVVSLDPAYVIYDLHHRRHVRTVKEHLRPLRIQTCGRFGDWEYFNMDHAILAGKQAAEAVPD